MATKVVMEGHRELIKSLKRVHSELPKEVAGIHKMVAEPIAEAARGRAPSVSGRLAGSIRAQGTQRVARVAAGKKAVPYAGAIHYGWPARGIAPNPFLQEALEAGADQAADTYTEELDRFLDRVWESIR